MARFQGFIQGGRGPTTRLGTPKSGMFVRANGWHLGGIIEATAQPNSTRDRVEFSLTSGSNGHQATKEILTVEEGVDGTLVVGAPIIIDVRGGVVTEATIAGYRVAVRIRDYDTQDEEGPRIERDDSGAVFEWGEA